MRNIMRTIEEIIQSSETEKEIPVSDVAWRRLERKLDKHDRSFRQTKVIYRSVAAVAAVIVFLLLQCFSIANAFFEQMKSKN